MPVPTRNKGISRGACCYPVLRNIVLGIDPPPDPPVESPYTVYWSAFSAGMFFPCGTDNEINGYTSPGVICGGYFNLSDFQEAGNIFLYSVGGSAGGWYVQMIVPTGNAVPTNFGTYSFDIFGNNSGPIPIEPIQNSNSTVNCYTATFDVDDVNTDGFSYIQYNGVGIDLGTPPPFSDPTHDAVTLGLLAAFLEPSATFVSSYVGNTVTITMTTLLIIESGIAGELPNVTEVIFTPCP